MISRELMASILLSWLVLFSYHAYVDYHYPSQNQEEASSQVEAQVLSSQQIEEVPNIAWLSDQNLTFEGEKVRFLFDQENGGLKSVILKKYLEQSGDKALELLKEPLVIQGIASQNDRIVKGFQGVRGPQSLTFQAKKGSWLLEQIYEQPDSTDYALHLTTRWTNVSSQPLKFQGGLYTSHLWQAPQESSSFLVKMAAPRRLGLIHRAGKNTERHEFKNFKDQKQVIHDSLPQDYNFYGWDLHIFLLAFLPQNHPGFLDLTTQLVSKDHCQASWEYRIHGFTVKPGESLSLNYKMWMGPKDFEAMSQHGELSSSLDWGWFSPLAKVFFKILKWLYGVFENWGLAIIVLTLGVKILLSPIIVVTTRSAARMRQHSGALKELQEKYKNDPMAQRQAMAKFMADNKLNPAKGCLLPLLQIPVFVALFNLLSSSVELKHAPFYGWIQDLSVADPYFVLPVIYTLTFWVQQKLTPMADPAQAQVMKWLPLFFGAMTLFFPSGMLIYFLTNQSFTLFQTYWLGRKSS